MQLTITLTVAESKRLIAKGFAVSTQTKAILESGKILVAPGTTNGYIVEELSHESFNKFSFVTGHTVAAAYDGPRPSKKHDGFLFDKHGVHEVTISETIHDLSAGDLFLKGVNAINYDHQEAAVLIGHPTGGTMGTTLGRITSKRIRLIHPTGLEKHIPGNLNQVARSMRNTESKGPTLWVTGGEIYTEIEAFNDLCDITAIPMASGGIGGAQGGYWFILQGPEAQVEHAESLCEEIKKEPTFLDGA